MNVVESRNCPILNVAAPVFDDSEAKPGLQRFRRKKQIVENGRTESPSLPNWRGHGGRHPTYSSVEFDRQLDKVSVWLEVWEHSQRCNLIEWILRHSNHNQFQFLFTVMQPHLHRDFMYNAQCYYPSMEFKPFSTYMSRELQQKLILHRQDNFYRVKSGYFRLDDEVKNQAKEKHSVKFPEIPIERHFPDKFQRIYTDLSSLNAVTGKPNSNLPQLKTSNRNVDTKKKKKNGLLIASNPELLYSSDPVLRFVDMPMKRHIQDEKNPQSLTTSTQSLNSAVTFPQRLQPNRLSFQDKTNSKHPSVKPGKKKTVKVEEKQPTLDENARTLIDWYMHDWSDVKRNEFLHKFILKLDPRQHYFISSFLSVRQHRDFLSLLPEKIALNILSYLSPKEILTCSRVSKVWFKLANSNDLWKYLCSQVDIKVPIPATPFWKFVYRDNVYLKRNWESGSCKVLDLRGHTDQVEEIIFNNKYIATGSQDKTIKLWEMRTGKLLQTLKGHDRGVWCLNFFTKNLLISGSHDGTIKIWNMKTGALARTIISHNGPVWAMVRHKEVLVSVSQDRLAKVWDISRCLLLHTLEGHNAAIFAVDMSENGSLIITGSADRTVRVWDAETGVKKQTIWASPSTSIMAVSYSNGFIACSYGETISLYNTNKGKLVKTFEEHAKRIETLKLKVTDKDKVCGSLISAGKDGMVKYWDLQRDNTVHTKKLKGFVKAIYFDDLRIASGNGNNVRMFDFNYFDTALIPKKEINDKDTVQELGDTNHSRSVLEVQTPGDRTPQGNTSRNKTHSDETPRDNMSPNKTPRDKTPQDKTPLDDLPGDNTPQDNTPRNKTPAEQSFTGSPTEPVQESS